MRLTTTLFLIVSVTAEVSNAASVENGNNVGGFVQSPHIAEASSTTQDKSQPIVFRMLLQKDGKVVQTCMGTEVHLKSDKIVWITAAECFDNTTYDSFRLETVYYGTFVSELFSFKTLFTPYEIHPNYNSETKENNIAVIARIRYLKDDKKQSSVLPDKNYVFINKEVDVFVEWKNVTTTTDAKVKFDLKTIHTKVIKPAWCKLWYPFSRTKNNNVCASGWYGKGLSKGIIGSPIIDTETQKYKLIGIATQNRHWTRWFGLPIEFLSIEPYIEWLQTIVFDLGEDSDEE